MSDKNITAPPVQIRDTSGNTVPFSWSKEKLVTITEDFEPGFPFQIYVGVGGDVVYEPWDNNEEALPQKEKVFFADATVTKTVADGTFLPILCRKIIFNGTTAGGITIGR